MSILSSAEDEQMQECDATASKKYESPSDTGDSDAEPNYSLSDDSYSYNLITRVLHLIKNKTSS